MTTTETLQRRDRRNVAVLGAANAILGAQMAMTVIAGGLIGQSLAENICYATLPISVIVLASMLSAAPLSAFMQRHGRRAGFILGAVAGMAGAAVSAGGLVAGSFLIFTAGSFLTGIFQSSLGFYRFAAADTADAAFRPKAISYVMAGGLFAAILGPQLFKLTAQAMVIPFLGTYLAIFALNLIGPPLFWFLDIPKPAPPAPDAPGIRSWGQLLRTPAIAAAIICGMSAYALMSLVMTATPLAVVGCGHSPGDAADVVMAHVLAMFGPSFFTGHLIARFGARRIVAAGLVFLTGAGAVALAGIELVNFYGALILIGLGWNFGFIGATAMLTAEHSEAERGRVQGLNDMIVFGAVAAASFASGGLMNCTGGDPVAGWNTVNLAMLPILALAGSALIWLAMRPAEPDMNAR